MEDLTLSVHDLELRRVVHHALSTWASGIHGPEARALLAADTKPALLAALRDVQSFAQSHGERTRYAQYRACATHAAHAALEAITLLNAPLATYRTYEEFTVRTHRKTVALDRGVRRY
jgi:hypothetical protein